MHSVRFHHHATKSQMNHRRGSALLVCTFAAVALSLSSLAIIRSSRVAVLRVDSLRCHFETKHVAHGLVQNAIAHLQYDPNFHSNVVDTTLKKSSPYREAYCSVVNDGTTANIAVFMYPGAPAFHSIVVDPDDLKLDGGPD